MSWRRFVVGGVTLLILLCLLSTAGAALFHISWSQGYTAGTAAAGGEAVVPVPISPGALGWAFGPRPALLGLGLFFTVGILFLLLGMVGKLFHSHVWRTAGGPADGQWCERWDRHWSSAHGPPPPWWCRLAEEKTEKAEPDAEAGQTEVDS